MAEIPCPTCHGSGLQGVPETSLNSRGEPEVLIVIRTCDTCAGNGRVQA